MNLHAQVKNIEKQLNQFFSGNDRITLIIDDIPLSDGDPPIEYREQKENEPVLDYMN
ncbi:hypothetical protein [Oceanobacillus sp. CF4.6]|uniref:hypothetical protein n=1 Tax=Oceanobacillus sp. CF4.6 TaxID=3373080 RepID=UPI003EE5D304